MFIYYRGPITEKKLSDILSFSSTGFSLQTVLVMETGKVTMKDSETL